MCKLKIVPAEPGDIAAVRHAPVTTPRTYAIRENCKLSMLAIIAVLQQDRLEKVYVAVVNINATPGKEILKHQSMIETSSRVVDQKTIFLHNRLLAK